MLPSNGHDTPPGMLHHSAQPPHDPEGKCGKRVEIETDMHVE